LSVVAAAGLIPCLLGLAPAAPPAAAPPVVFSAQAGGTYDGLPLFDAEPSHLDAYLDVLIEYVGLEGAARWAFGWRDDYTLTTGPNAGKTIPGSPQFAEHVHGVNPGGTAFPAPIALSQMWDKDLLGGIGQIISEEKLYTQDYTATTAASDVRSAFNAMISSALQDVRANPLSGRLEEGLGEDPQLASQLIQAMSRGISGIDDPASQDGFWTKAVLGTKHFTNYQAQWYRTVGSVDASQRHLMENASYPASRAISDGTMSAFMTSYGRTNGIPNNVSPLVQYAQSLAPYGMHQTNDHSSENQLATPGSYSNGFDQSYTPSDSDSAALFVLANTGGIAATWPDRYVLPDILDRIEAGTYGVTAEDVYEVAKAQVTPLIRVGLFNEYDPVTGVPIDYPFADLSATAATTPINWTVRSHQETALAAAQESIVLLKNQDAALPLSKDAAVAVVGPLSNARFPNTYANAVSVPGADNGGLTPLQGIDAVGRNIVGSATDGNVVRLKSVATGQYVTHDPADPDNLAFADQATPATAASFEVFDWGQDAVSLRSTSNGRWVQFAQSQCFCMPGIGCFPPGCDAAPPSAAVNVGQDAQFGTASTTLPNRLQLLDNTDGTVSIVANGFGGGFGGGFETALYTSGRYLTVDPSTGEVGATDPFGSATGMAAANTVETRFEVEVVQAAGTQAAEIANTGAEYAIVVLGHPSRNSSGEGSDRSTLYLGAEQYELAQEVAAQYPGKTIVVLSTCYPVIAESLQDDPNIAAILAYPYGGQYDGYALGQVIYGDYAPTGRLTQTWHADMSALPPISAYSIPEGQNQTTQLTDIDPRITVDMTNGDPIEAGLTYQYTESPVTYPFGYGLSYSTFSYSNLTLGADGQGGYQATVDVANTGSVDTAEVVQLYARNPDWSYGQAAPRSKLVAFERIEVAAGATASVTLAFDASNLALWNTNADGWRIEPGTYEFTAASSSDTPEATAGLVVAGDEWPELDATTAPVSVFDKAFAANQVTYRESSKANTLTGLREDRLVNGYYTVMSREAGAWVALSDLKFDASELVKLTVASTNQSSSLQLRLDAPDGPVIGTAEFGNTGRSPYVIAGNTSAGDIAVNEIGYTEIEIPLAQTVEGTRDLFIVFGEPDVRVRDLYVEPGQASPTLAPPSDQPSANQTPTAGSSAPAAPASPGVSGDAKGVAGELPWTGPIGTVLLPLAILLAAAGMALLRRGRGRAGHP
jgi:beta-glucosidase-like glycosyl hydrolase